MQSQLEKYILKAITSEGKLNWQSYQRSVLSNVLKNMSHLIILNMNMGQSRMYTDSAGDFRMGGTAHTLENKFTI